MIAEGDESVLAEGLFGARVRVIWLLCCCCMLFRKTNHPRLVACLFSLGAKLHYLVVGIEVFGCKFSRLCCAPGSSGAQPRVIESECWWRARQSKKRQPILIWLCVDDGVGIRTRVLTLQPAPMLNTGVHANTGLHASIA